MSYTKLLEELDKAACRWEKDNPIVGVGELRYCDALRDAAFCIKKLLTDVERRTEERDEAVNCIYGIREAMDNGDAKAATEELITYEFKYGKRTP